MVSIAADHRPQVLLVPVREDQVEVERGLATVPDVERLIHHEKAHPVDELEQFGRRGIVRHADGVRPHVTQDLELPLGRARVECRAERAKVVVLIDAVDDDPLDR